MRTRAIVLVGAFSTAAHADSYTIQEIPTLGGAQSTAEDVVCGGGGAVVGSAENAAGETHAIVFERGVLTDLGTLGGTSSAALAANARGVAVGFFTLPGSILPHAFVAIDSVMTELPGLGGDLTIARAINPRGQIVGEAAPTPGLFRAALWEDGHVISLGTLGGLQSQAEAINARGEVVGLSQTGPGEFHAYRWTRKEGMVDLGAGSAGGSAARAINNAGTVAGATFQPGRSVAVMWKAGAIIELGTLGGDFGGALDLDDRDRVVGSATDQTGSLRAFLYHDGVMIDLNSLVDATDWTLQEATGICADGRISGNGLHDGAPRGFLLVPAP